MMLTGSQHKQHRTQREGRPDNGTSPIDRQHSLSLAACSLGASSLGASLKHQRSCRPLAWQHGSMQLPNVSRNEDTTQRPMSGQGARHLRIRQDRCAGLQPGGCAHALLCLVVPLLRQPDVTQLAPAAHARGAVSAATRRAWFGVAFGVARTAAEVARDALELC